MWIVSGVSQFSKFEFRKHITNIHFAHKKKIDAGKYATRCRLTIENKLHIFIIQCKLYFLMEFMIIFWRRQFSISFKVN